MNYLKLKRGLFSIGCAVVLVLLPLFVQADTISSQSVIPDFKLQIPIEGLAGGVNIHTYLAAVYRWLMRAAVVFALVMLVIAGIVWMVSRGESGLTKKAHDIIKSTFIGLGLALGSYTILFAVNANLVNFDVNIEFKEVTKLEIPIEPMPIDALDSGDTEGDPSTTVPPGDVHCPNSGGVAEMPKILNSLKNKVTYRFGGKGGPPNYSEVKSDYMKYNTYCPQNTVCLDCSGFINYVYKCAGMSSGLGGTANIFSGSKGEAVTSINGDVINGIKLKPGDLVGYRPGELHAIGHVLIYMGDGLVAQSAGGDSGRQPGANPKLNPITDQRVKRMIKRVRRL